MAPSMTRTPPSPQQAGQVPRRAPGPFGLPWLGQLPAFLGSNFFPRTMLSWSEQYKGVYQFEIVGKKYVVVSDPSLVPSIVGRGCQGLPKSDGYNMWDPIISPHAGVMGLFTTPENGIWRTVRRSYGPAFGPGSLSSHLPVVLRCATQLGDLLEGSGRAGAAPLELDQLLKALTMDMLCLSAFDHDPGCLDDPKGAALLHSMELGMAECGERGRGVGRRLAPWLFEEDRGRGQEAITAVHTMVEDIWRGIKARGPFPESDTSMSAQLYRLAYPSRGSGGALSEAQVCAEITTILAAGYETTASALTWMLFGLWAHPEAAARLEEELRQAGLLVTSAEPVDSPTTTSSAIVTDPRVSDPTAAAFLALPGGYDTLANLPYLDAYIKESLRLYSTAPNGQLKQVPADGPPARVGAYEAPPGSIVWVPFWSVHLSALNWERPLEFLPERWLTGAPSGVSRCPVGATVGALRTAAAAVVGAAGAGAGTGVTTLAVQDSGSDSTDGSGSDSEAAAAAAAPGGGGGRGLAGRAVRYLPFGEGSRKCPGQHIATLQLKVVVSYIFSRFRMRLDEQTMGGLAGALDRQFVNLTLGVRDGMWMFAEPRTPQQP